MSTIEMSLSGQYLQQVGGSMVHGSYTASVALKTAGETDELCPTHLPSVLYRGKCAVVFVVVHNTKVAQAALADDCVWSPTIIKI